MSRTTFGSLFEGQGHSMTFQHNCVRPITSLFEVLFKNYFIYKWSPCWDDVSHTTFGSLPWRSRSQHDLSAKKFQAHNFVIWSQILQLFHRNDHHIETTCHVQHLGCYREGQGHSMTLHQNRVWSKTLLFEVRFYNYFWQTTSLCPIRIRGALPGSDRLLFISKNIHTL